MNKKISVVYGDGIGPEIMEAVLSILKTAKVDLAIDVVEAGEKQFERGFVAGIAPSAFETILNNKVILKAPITTPQGKGYKSLNVTLRKGLGLFANVRPVKSHHPYVRTHFPDLDMVIIRENEEDLYTGIEYRYTANDFSAQKMVSATGSEKIIRYAFEYAVRNGRKKVTCMMKDNIMKLTDGTFHRVFDEVAKEYKNIEAEQMIIDIGAAKIASNPERFDVVVTMNLYGDIISDIAAEVSGSVGLAGSANIGSDYAMFEAVHGSAPDIAGKNIANPSGLLNAAIMMLNHLGLYDDAERIKKALYEVVEEGLHTADIFKESVSSKKVSTQEFAEAICQKLREKYLKSEGVKSLAQDKDVSHSKNSAALNMLDVKKDLVGVDIYLENKFKNISELVEVIRDISSGGALQLQFVAAMGLKLWPEMIREISLEKVGLLQLRFVSNRQDKSVTHNEICNLLLSFSSTDHDFVKTENLYVFDGKVGFSLD